MLSKGGRMLAALHQNKENPKPAILAPGRIPLAFSGLHSFVTRTADRLCDMGVQRGHRIAYAGPNGPESATAFLALASCAGFAPLNPSYTQREYEFYLLDLKADAFLASPGSAESALAAAMAVGIPLIRMEAELEAPAGVFRLTCDRALEPPDPARQEAALLLHTSGTTSRPKLVPLSEDNLCASARNISRTLSLTPDDRCLNIMPLFHIHGLMAALLASIQSSASVVCTDGVYGNRFFDWMEEFRPTWYTAVPTMHQAILSRAREREETARGAALRFLRSSSASLPPSVLDNAEKAFQAPLVEAYGMTEAAHQMACNPLPPDIRKAGSVGLPAGPEIAIMNQAGDMLEVGEVGEVVVRGLNVMAGYEDNPEANRAAFTDGWFRTGDQGRLDGEGYLHLTGRLKELINRGGEKISPREIDEVMLEHAAVKQALCFAIPHAQLGEEVGLAVELRHGATASESELRLHAFERLPAFKVPKVVRVLEEIPKGPTGKLQRIGFAERIGIERMDNNVGQAEYVEPRNEAERRVAGIWSEILRRDGIGALDRFESLGGDSLMSVVAMTAVNREFGLDLPFLKFLDQGTVESMAAEIVDVTANPRHGARLFPVESAGERVPLFCCPGHDGVMVGLRRLSLELKGTPMWALSLPQEIEAASVPELGAKMAEEVSRLHRDGPVVLVGVCFGGLVAFEAACRLEQSGRDVDLLVMIDTLNPAWRREAGSIEVGSALARMGLSRVGPHLRAMADRGLKGGAEYVADRFSAFRQTVDDIDHAYRKAQAVYTPRAEFRGRTVLFEMEARRLPAPLLGWQEHLTGEVRMEKLPFDTSGSLSERAAPMVASGLCGDLDAITRQA